MQTPMKNSMNPIKFLEILKSINCKKSCIQFLSIHAKKNIIEKKNLKK